MPRAHLAPQSGRPEGSAISQPSFEHVMVGDLRPEEVADFFFDCLQEPAAGVDDRIYEAFRSLTWKLLTGRCYGAQVRPWRDVMRQVGGALEAKKFDVAALRVRVLSELIVESCRFGETHSAAAMAERPHVRAILNVVTAEGGYVMRGVVRDKTRLGEANLSRILANMSSVGLIDRNMVGREVSLSITSLAKEIVQDSVSAAGAATNAPTGALPSWSGPDILSVSPSIAAKGR